MIIITSWLLNLSQIPSDPITRILSLELRLGKYEISGFAVTPTLVAAMSPIERVMARPGTYLFLSQTRLGP